MGLDASFTFDPIWLQVVLTFAITDPMINQPLTQNILSLVLTVAIFP
jgi:hypothetical protein